MVSACQNSFKAVVYALTLMYGLAAVATTTTTKSPPTARQMLVPTLLPPATGTLTNMGNGVFPGLLPIMAVLGLGVFAVPLILLAVQFFSVGGGSVPGVPDIFLSGALGRKMDFMKTGKDVAELLSVVTKALEKMSKN